MSSAGALPSSKALVRAANAGISDAGGTSLRRQTILGEEDYIHSVSTIIQRDFFPDLERLKAENEYLAALQSGDEDWIEASVRALVRAERRAEQHMAASAAAVQTPRHRHHLDATPTPCLAQLGRIPPPSRSASTAAPTPRIAAPSSLAHHRWDDNEDKTPLAGPYANYPDTRSTVAGPSRYAASEASHATNAAAGKEEQEQGPPADLSLSLSAFQRAYTSEDNASFARLLQLNAMKRRERYAWAYKAEEAANQKRNRAEDKARIEAQHGQRLAIAAAVEADPSFLKRLKGKERLLIEAGPSASDQQAGNDSQDAEKQEFDPEAALKPIKDERPASFPSWRSKARNAFFFGPDANIATYDRSTSSLPSASSADTSASATGSSGPSTSATDVRKIKANQPAIRLHALRMPDPDGTDSALRREGGLTRGPDSPSSSRIDAAIAGRGGTSSTTHRDGSSSLTGADDSMEAETESALSSPRINGYGFVTPLAHTPRDESVLGDYLDSIGADWAMRRSLGLGEVFDEEGERRVLELKRWGRENVPVQAEGDRAGEEVYDGTFRVPPTPRRDEIGRRLAQSKASFAPTSRAGASRTGQSQSQSQAQSSKGRCATAAAMTMTPRSSAANLSPAARMLLERTAKGRTGGGGSGSSSSHTVTSSTPHAHASGRLGDTLLRKRAAAAASGPGATFGEAGEEERRRRRRVDVGLGVRDREAGTLRRTRWTPAPSPAPG